MTILIKDFLLYSAEDVNSKQYMEKCQQYKISRGLRIYLYLLTMKTQVLNLSLHLIT